MSAPFFLLGITALLSIAVLALRRNTVPAVALTALGAFSLSLFTLWVSIEDPMELLGMSVRLEDSWSILGRSLVLDESNRASVGFLYGIGAFIFAGGLPAKAGVRLYVVGLLTLLMVAASLMIRPFVFAPLFIEFAVMGSAILLASARDQAQRGSLRLLTLYTFSMMAILVAGWMLEVSGVTSGTPELAQRVTLLLAVGFAILMAVPPFHIWLPSASENAHPYSFAFVSVVLQSSGLFFLLRFLDTYAWLRGDPSLFIGLRWLAIGIIAFGAFWSLAQRSFVRMFAYALLMDFGVMLLAVGTGTSSGFQLALGLSGVRVLSAAVWGLGASTLFADTGKLDEASLEGIAHRSPFGSAAAIIGVFSLAGVPLTAGFPARWALLSALGPLSIHSGIALLLSIAAVGAAGARWLRIFQAGDAGQAISPTTLVERVYLLGGVAICVGLGIFPQTLFPWVIQAAEGLSNLVP